MAGGDDERQRHGDQNQLRNDDDQVGHRRPPASNCVTEARMKPSTDSG